MTTAQECEDLRKLAEGSTLDEAVRAAMKGQI